MYEKVHTAVVARFDAATGVKKRLLDWALPIGREVSRLEGAGEPVPAGTPSRSSASPTGSSSARCGSRSAEDSACPDREARRSSKEIIEFFDAVGIRITEGYGLTECTTAASTNRPDLYRFGSVGPAAPGLRGAHRRRRRDRGPVSETVFQGYFKDPEATAAVLSPDGWLKTGDIGHLDEEGFLHITDRKKDILVTAGGKNVAPQNIENDLKTSKYVSQALVVGDKRPYVAALITLDPVGDRPLGGRARRGRRRRALSPPTSASTSSSRAPSTMRTASARASSRSSASPSSRATSRWRRARSPRR